MITIIDKQFVHGAWSVSACIDRDDGCFIGSFVVEGEESMTNDEIVSKIQEGL